jgi:hypothetical protein
VATSVPGQNARVTFAGTNGQRVSLKLTGVTIGTSTCCSARVSIINPDGTTLAAPAFVGTNGGFVDMRTLPAGGFYSILVDPQEMVIGGATLTLYDVPPDASASITLGGPAVSVTTSVPGQNSRLSFAGTSGQRISLKVGPSCCQTRVSVLKPDGSALVTPTYLTTSTGFIDTRTLPASGTYTILVDPQEMVTGSTTVTLYDIPPDASATIAPGGPAVTVTTSVPGQNARVTFAGAAGQSITLKLGAVTISISKVSVTKPDGTSLIAPTHVFTSGKTFTAQLPVTGTYAITIDPDAANVGSITLTLS